MDAGILAAQGVPVVNPLPVSWLGLTTAPVQPPTWSNIGPLNNTQIKNLLAQIGYDQSAWDYTLVDNNNTLGRYQITPALLESYGLLATGSNAAYGNSCVNYRHCWQPTYINNGQNVYENYFYNITNLTEFLNTPVAQEHLAYQRISDLYVESANAGVIQPRDSSETVAGMIYVAWALGVGQGPEDINSAWAWRYNNANSTTGINKFNAGRYSVAVLSR